MRRNFSHGISSGKIAGSLAFLSLMPALKILDKQSPMGGLGLVRRAALIPVILQRCPDNFFKCRKMLLTITGRIVNYSCKQSGSNAHYFLYFCE